MTPLLDAHNHLHDERLLHSFPELLPAMRKARIGHCVVNGTCQDNWPRVMSLARRYPDLLQPSLGLHPWKIASRSPDWLEKLKRTLPSPCTPEQSFSVNAALTVRSRILISRIKGKNSRSN
ncbi:MAG TPA: hypothetical protein DCS85_08845 [Verrucomicrobiales bacterium]|nr:hypothetical protein [Deltaproteobacteria bacterium]HAT20249.1 hypothetical protein [Verrucomicrobiales bacterium]